MNKERISEIAYQIWLNEGSPDGEEIIKTIFGRMKVREIHWMKAENIIEAQYYEDQQIFKYMEICKNIDCVFDPLDFNHIGGLVGTISFIESK